MEMFVIEGVQPSIDFDRLAHKKWHWQTFAKAACSTMLNLNYLPNTEKPKERSTQKDASCAALKKEHPKNGEEALEVEKAHSVDTAS